ncbi:MAG: glycosyltransferase [Lachnospiraceae bacterium]|nr:glycosyltransferase [Lachnospiraceae bacterium]
MVRVSVIVIIYKVAAFLEECLDSIINQTCKDIEIICVLGKGDRECEQICRSFEERDGRIRLIIEEAGGTAKARNTGLDAATGDYIAFVDGDDHIDPDMIEKMLDLALKYETDISVIGRYYDYKNCTESNTVGEETVLDIKGALSVILYQTGFFLHIWDKLYKKELFYDLRFDEGKKVEDRQVVYRLLVKAGRIAYDPVPKYHFRVSRDSGSRVSDNLVRSLEADKEIASDILFRYEELKPQVVYFLVYETMSVIQNNMLYGTFSVEHDKENLKYVKRHRKEIYNDKNVSKSVKLKTFLCSFFPGLLKIYTIKMRSDFLKKHEEFSTGTDWNETFRDQGIKD